MVLRGWSGGRVEPGRARTGRYNSTRPPDPCSDAARPARHRRTSPACRPIRNARPQRSSRDGPSSTSSATRPWTLWRHGLRGAAASSVRLAGSGSAQPGIGVRLAGGLSIELDLTVAYGLPIAEVARQVDSAVRYGIRRALGREVDG